MQGKRIAMLLATAAALVVWPSVSFGVVLWTSHHGETRISLDTELMKKAGLSVSSLNPDDTSSTANLIVMEVSPDEIPFVMDLKDGIAAGFEEGLIRHTSGLRIRRGSQSVDLNSFIIGVGSSDLLRVESGLSVEAPAVDFDRFRRSIGVSSDDVVITRNLAEALGAPSLAGVSIGHLTSEVFLAWAGGELPPPKAADDEPLPRICASPVLGPDVIVGDLQSVSSYAVVGSTAAFSVGTYSCNLGNVPVRWQSGNNLHPVIPQSLYRYKVVGGAGRLEQIGISWCKHGFTALSDNICCPCTGPGGSQLGVGCADPYTSGRNGSQLTTTGGLGPRFDINAHTGVFTFPYPFRNTNGSVALTSITRRVQVATSDLAAASNPGAQYFVEAQYVTQDDAAWNNSGTWSLNANNNCSYRPVTVSPSGANYVLALSGSVTRGSPAIKAWKAIDASVTETNIDVPEIEFPAGSGNNKGRVILSAKATDLGGGVYRYEYAMFNLNSDRSIKSFSVPVAGSLTATNIEFHDVNYHSGDGYNSTPTAQITFDGTDWPGTQGGGNLSWTMVNASPVENSNALRWGTLYNFRFDVAAPPTTGDVSLGIFKAVTGLPDSVAATTVIPSVPCTAPIILPIPAAAAVCDTAFTYTPLLGAGTLPLTWSLSGEPAGMVINSSTGQIDWPNTVASASPYSVTVTAQSQCGPGSDSKTLTLTVARGDFTGDGVVDLADIVPFTDDVTGVASVSLCAADMNGDGLVNGDDIQLFVDALLP